MHFDATNSTYTSHYRRKIRPNDPYADAPMLPGESTASVAIHEIFKDISLDQASLELEIGGGRGAFAIERLTHQPNVYLLGFEVRRKWATIVDRKLSAIGLGARGRVFAEDARYALPRLVPSSCVDTVFLHFPDPWWKKRHEKRLVINDIVQNEIERLLKPHGELFIQTDVESRAIQYKAFLDSRVALTSAGDTSESPFLIENPYGAQSPREKRAIADGIPIYRLRYRKN